jgi:hypothetical protein
MGAICARAEGPRQTARASEKERMGWARFGAGGAGAGGARLGSIGSASDMLPRQLRHPDQARCEPGRGTRLPQQERDGFIDPCHVTIMVTYAARVIQARARGVPEGVAPGQRQTWSTLELVKGRTS